MLSDPLAPAPGWEAGGRGSRLWSGWGAGTKSAGEAPRAPTLGRGHEHREEAAVVRVAEAEAVGRRPGDGRAVAGTAVDARPARAARDLERHDHAVAWRERRDVVAHLHDLRHALVPDHERRLEGRAAGDDQSVEVAGGHGDRANEGDVVALDLERLRVASLELALAHVGEAGHGGQPMRSGRTR